MFKTCIDHANSHRLFSQALANNCVDWPNDMFNLLKNHLRKDQFCFHSSLPSSLPDFIIKLIKKGADQIAPERYRMNAHTHRTDVITSCLSKHKPKPSIILFIKITRCTVQHAASESGKKVRSKKIRRLAIPEAHGIESRK